VLGATACRDLLHRHCPDKIDQTPKPRPGAKSNDVRGARKIGTGLSRLHAKQWTWTWNRETAIQCGDLFSGKYGIDKLR